MCYLPSFLKTQIIHLKGSDCKNDRPKTKQQRICVGCTCLFYWLLCIQEVSTASCALFCVIGTFSCIADADLPPIEYRTLACLFDRFFATLGSVRILTPLFREGLWGSLWQFAFMAGIALFGFWTLHRSRQVPKTVAAGWQWTFWHSTWHTYSVVASFYFLHHERTNGV